MLQRILGSFFDDYFEVSVRTKMLSRYSVISVVKGSTENYSHIILPRHQKLCIYNIHANITKRFSKFIFTQNSLNTSNSRNYTACRKYELKFFIEM